MKQMRLIPILLLLITTSLTAQNSTTDAALYRKAIREAMYPETSKVDTQLVPISKTNKKLIWKTFDNEDHVLCVSWKQNISYYKPYLDSAYYNTGKYAIWISTAPELKERMKVLKPKNPTRRLIQLLGLPPNAQYSYFVEFWVRPCDLFRPCPDKEITDRRCDVCFPDNVDQQHQNWINSSRIDRYYQCDLYNQYPWTELGYTYDWNPTNKTHVGLSEFVIAPNSKIKVKAIYSTAEYLK